MARIRTIKPEFWTDGAILECSTNARLLFLGLLNFADDNGNIDGSPKTIKAQILPADDINVSPLLTELRENGLVIFYQVDRRVYLHIKGFKDHQKIDRPGKPRCPLYEDSMKVRRTIAEPSLQEGKGMEGNGSGGGGGEKKTAPVPPPKWLTILKTCQGIRRVTQGDPAPFDDPRDGAIVNEFLIRGYHPKHIQIAFFCFCIWEDPYLRNRAKTMALFKTQIQNYSEVASKSMEGTRFPRGRFDFKKEMEKACAS